MTSSNRSMARLLRPGSVAIVGASNRSGSFSYNLLNSLRSNGYQGQLLPINPRYTEIDGIPCYPSFADLPVTPDCALYAVGDRNLIPMVELAAQAGVGGGVIFGRVQGHDDQGRDIQSSISEIGRGADMAICGGNCMGYLNLRDGLQVAGMPFAGLTASSPFWTIVGAVAMFVSRYWLIVPVLALAGSLAMKKAAPIGQNSFPTHGALFVTLLTVTILLVGGLTFLPTLALGPIAEHLSMGF